mmetsp:Transcript_5290/g.16119  ORF Transcript_5290/g.16119 Transcript_5290/m.16119 type:complete len:227 (-) Transcript_5290:43-723(-)
MSTTTSRRCGFSETASSMSAYSLCRLALVMYTSVADLAISPAHAATICVAAGRSDHATSASYSGLSDSSSAAAPPPPEAACRLPCCCSAHTSAQSRATRPQTAATKRSPRSVSTLESTRSTSECTWEGAAPSPSPPRPASRAPRRQAPASALTAPCTASLRASLQACARLRGTSSSSDSRKRATSRESAASTRAPSPKPAHVAHAARSAPLSRAYAAALRRARSAR